MEGTFVTSTMINEKGKEIPQEIDDSFVRVPSDDENEKKETIIEKDNHKTNLKRPNPQNVSKPATANTQDPQNVSKPATSNTQDPQNASKPATDILVVSKPEEHEVQNTNEIQDSQNKNITQDNPQKNYLFDSLVHVLTKKNSQNPYNSADEEKEKPEIPFERPAISLKMRKLEKPINKVKPDKIFVIHYPHYADFNQNQEHTVQVVSEEVVPEPSYILMTENVTYYKIRYNGREFRRRFSQFKALRSHLQKKYFGYLVPHLDDSKKLKHLRKYMLQYFLQKLISHTTLANESAVINFLDSNAQYLPKQKEMESIQILFENSIMNNLIYYFNVGKTILNSKGTYSKAEEYFKLQNIEQRIECFIKKIPKLIEKAEILRKNIDQTLEKARNTENPLLQATENESFPVSEALCNRISKCTEILKSDHTIKEKIEEFIIAPAEDLKKECESIKSTIELLFKKYKAIQASGNEIEFRKIGEILTAYASECQELISTIDPEKDTKKPPSQQNKQLGDNIEHYLNHLYENLDLLMLEVLSRMHESTKPK